MATLEQVRKAVDEGNKKFLDAWRTSDPALYVSEHTEDCIRLFPGTPMVRGREALYEVMVLNMTDSGFVDGSIETLELEVFGHLAYEVGHYSFTFQQADGTHQTDTGKYLVIWKEQADGSWKFHVDGGFPRA